MAELEQAASKQMHGLVQQSTQTLEIMQSKLTLAESQLHQLRTFIEVSELSYIHVLPLSCVFRMNFTELFKAIFSTHCCQTQRVL